MKKVLLVAALLQLLVGTGTSYAQSDEAIQLGLNLEKLAQFKQILSDLKKGYEIVDKGYSSIKDISEGNFNLHKTFLDELMAVSPAVKKYKRVTDIISCQLTLVKEYKAALERFRTANCFKAGELDYISRTYDNLFKRSLRILEDLTIIVTADKLRMNDEERLKAIDGIYEDMTEKLVFLRQFNNSTSVLVLQRAKEQHDAANIRKAYGIKD